MKLIKLKKNKAQAAITDALFFLTIIMVLAIMLFKISATYGQRVKVASTNLYFKEYTSSVLKTIFFSEIPLNDKLEISSTEETDYLMTAIKSDYFADQKIGASNDINTMSKAGSYFNEGDIAKFNLYHVIKATMNPLPNYDYLFYLFNPENPKNSFDFFMIKITTFDLEPGTGKNKYTESGVQTGANYYLCDPYSYDNIKNIMYTVSDIYSSSIPLRFTFNDLHQNSTSNVANLRSTFTIWPANYSINNDVLMDKNNKMNCKLYESITYP